MVNRILTHAVKGTLCRELCENVCIPIEMQFGMLRQVGPGNMHYIYMGK